MDEGFFARVAAMIAPWTRGYRKVGECEVCGEWLVVGPGGFKTQYRCAKHRQVDPLSGF